MAEHEYVEPQKRIASIQDMEHWHNSRGHAALVGFIRSLNDAVIGLKTTDASTLVSARTTAVIAQLDRLDRIAQEVEPEPGQHGRYGNKAYRTWHERMVASLPEIHDAVLPDAAKMAGAAKELSAYLADGFGNSTRIDYGSGHELSFVAWLGCLHACGALLPEDRAATVTRVFVRYLELVRMLQLRYRLEPAGSHGVWGIDDYQFLPFLWGAAQLVDHPTIMPGSILDPRTVSDYYKDYLYLSCVKFTTTWKKGAFHEHSPDLFNITAAVSWRKINNGMFKKYDAEVLAKFPIVQHFFFGSIFQW